jgi:hypothetical protein
MYLSRSRAVSAAEDQREQITLFVSQRRKRVHHLLDMSVQVVLVVATLGTASAVLARPRQGT